MSLLCLSVKNDFLNLIFGAKLVRRTCWMIVLNIDQRASAAVTLRGEMTRIALIFPKQRALRPQAPIVVKLKSAVIL